MTYATDPRYGTARWKTLRVAVLERDERTCGYCGADATTVDHRTPHSRGGDFWDPANLVAACAGCNYSKSDRARPVLPPAVTLPYGWPYGPCRFHGTACGALHSEDW